MEEYQLRVKEEAVELKTKLDKLKVFLEGEVFMNLPRSEREDLFEQKVYMTQYLKMLNRRIFYFSNVGASQAGQQG